MKVLSFGEILWDVFPEERFLGGASLNFAAHLARHGEEVYMLSALGRDELGKETLECLKKWNISEKYVAVLDGEITGKCLVTLDENKIPSYNLLNNVAYDKIQPSVEEDFDLLYFGTLALRGDHNLDAVKILTEQKSFKEIFVDLNIRAPYYSRERVLFAVSKATVLKISDEELPVVASLLDLKESGYEELAGELAERFGNLRTVIITLGASGSFALDAVSGERYSTPVVPCKIKSTVGAGDSFSAGFIHKYFKGENTGKCLEYASKLASFVVAHTEAVPEYILGDFE